MVKLFMKPQEDTEIQWVSVAGTAAFVFRVRACENVQIMLATILGNAHYGASKIIIGEDNMKSYFHPNTGEPISAETPNILDCDEFRAFYIRWTAYTVHVGYGANIAGTPFVEFITLFGQLDVIQSIGMMSTTNHSVEYEMVKFIGTLGLFCLFGVLYSP